MRALIIAAVVGTTIFGLIIWVVSTGPRMSHQLAQCEIGANDGQIRRCMETHGWSYNQDLASCDNGSVRDIGCYETGFGT